jgi:hypothetical protein
MAARMGPEWVLDKIPQAISGSSLGKGKKKATW